MLRLCMHWGCVFTGVGRTLCSITHSFIHELITFISEKPNHYIDYWVVHWFHLQKEQTALITMNVLWSHSAGLVRNLTTYQPTAATSLIQDSKSNCICRNNLLVCWYLIGVITTNWLHRKAKTITIEIKLWSALNKGWIDHEIMTWYNDLSFHGYKLHCIIWIKCFCIKPFFYKLCIISKNISFQLEIM